MDSVRIISISCGLRVTYLYASISMFNQQELQILLGGVDAAIDVQDLRAHTQYGGAYKDGEPTIEAFWKVLESFNQEQKRGLLRFVTSCSRPPLL